MKIRVSFLAAAALLTLSSASVLAQGESASEAEVHLRRGLDLAKDSDWDAALVELRRAYAITPRWQTLAEVGRAATQVHRWAEALDAYEKVLADGRKDVPEGRRDELQKEIEKLRTRVATVMVTTSVPGVEISIDDTPAGRTPLAAPIRVSAGHRRVTATRAGQPPVSQMLELAGGDAREIALAIPDAPADASPAADAPKTPPLPTARRLTWLPWLITAGLGASAVATGVAALNASSDLRTLLGTYPVTPNALQDAHTKTQAFAVATDALVAGTVLVGALSVYYTVTAPAAPQPPAAAVVRIHADPQGVRLSGTF